MKEIFGTIGVILMLGSGLPYAVSLWRREVKPHAFSWLLWGTINSVVLAAQITGDAGSGGWSTACSALVCYAIAIYALKYGEKNYTRSDWLFLTLALLAIPLWIMTDDPLWSVIAVCIIDTLAFMPTVRKTWLKPHEESLSSFALGAGGFFFALLALQDYRLANVLYPGLVMTANTLFVITMMLRKKYTGGKHA